MTTTDRDRFAALLEGWKQTSDAIDALKEKQNTLAEDLNKVYAKVITEEQLLAALPWEFSLAWNGGSSLKCRRNDIDDFLSVFNWDDHQSFYHHQINIGDHFINIDDGEVSIYLKDVNAMISFCHEQGIKPDMAAIQKQLDDAQREANRYKKLIKDLTPTEPL